VTIIGRREDVLASAAAEINAEVGADRVSVVSADLSQPDQVERAAMAVLADADAVDVVVNAAGGVGGAAEQGLQGVVDDWEGEFRRNVLTAVLLVAALDPRLRRPGATIVNVSSIAALPAAATPTPRPRPRSLGGRSISRHGRDGTAFASTRSYRGMSLTPSSSVAA
jgi:NAD(P)-dependent dehydrogenase (short-subunit alcohol dehydrogenase family)